MATKPTKRHERFLYLLKTQIVLRLPLGKQNLPIGQPVYWLPLNTHLLISKTKSFSIIFSLPVCYFFLSCFFVFFRGFRGYFFFTLLLSCFFVVFVAIFFSTLLFSCFFVGFVAISIFTLLFSCPFVGFVAISFFTLLFSCPFVGLVAIPSV